MFKLLTILLTGCGIILSFICQGQYLENVPLGTLPMQYNPSFAGQAGSPRVSSNIQYTQNRNNYYFRSRGFGAVASYDQFIPAIRSGVGITVGYSNSQTNINNVYGLLYDKGTSNGTLVSIAFAPKISLKGKYTISPSIELTYGAVGVSHMLNRVRVIDSLFYIPDTQHGINSSAGILFNTPKLYIGYTVSLLRRTIGDSRFNPVNMLPRDWFYSNLQAGYTVFSPDYRWFTGI
jgi:hypothetical protein